MSEETTARLRKLQDAIVSDSAYALNRNELIRMRVYWGEIEAALALDTDETGE